MRSIDWMQLALFAVALIAITKPMGLYLMRVLDVDGRIGGFNFQWAWSSAYVAARALAAGRRT